MIFKKIACTQHSIKRLWSSYDTHRFGFIGVMTLLCLNVGCWGEVDPSNPFDEETPIERQARGDAKVTVIFPPDVVEAPADAYIEWTPIDDPDNFVRVFFLDADTVSNTTTSQGAQMTFIFERKNLTPGSYAIFVFSPGFTPTSQAVLELGIDEDAKVEITLTSD